MIIIEAEAWRHGTDWQRLEGRRGGDNGGKKGKGLVKEHRDWLWEQGVGSVVEGSGGKIGTTVIK